MATLQRESNNPFSLSTDVPHLSQPTVNTPPLEITGSPHIIGLMIELQTGRIVHWLRLEGLITELYDVQVLPGVQRPMALGFQSEEIQRLITLDPMGKLLNPKLQETEL